MERNYIGWNVSNWITVVLMFIIACLVVNVVAYGFDRVTG